MESQGGQARVVVLGAGFGGLTFCKSFRHPHACVTMVDRTNHHLFQPLLYQVAMAGLAAPDIAQPVRSILSREPRLEVLMDTVRDFDLRRQIVYCDRNELPFDYLVLAMGGMTSYFGHPEWEAFAPGLKTIEDALNIRRNVLLAFERAETERDPERRKHLMTIVVVGGGPTGVELAGACAELAFRVLRRDFDRIDPTCASVILIEGAQHVLEHLPPELSVKAEKQLTSLGVQVITNARVQAVQKGCLQLSTGEEIYAENIIWAAGVMANPLTKKLGVELDRAGRVQVRPDLSLPGYPNVFAIGDLAGVQQPSGQPVPGVAPAAMQMAKYVAEAVHRRLDAQGDGQPIEPFLYRDKGKLATIGRSRGVAQFGKIKLSGFPAWLAWLCIHLVFLIGFRNKLRVLISWIYAYFTYSLGARLITGVREQPVSARAEGEEVQGPEDEVRV